MATNYYSDDVLRRMGMRQLEAMRGRLYTEQVVDDSDAEIERAFDRCVVSWLIPAAKLLRDEGVVLVEPHWAGEWKREREVEMAEDLHPVCDRFKLIDWINGASYAALVLTASEGSTDDIRALAAARLSRMDMQGRRAAFRPTGAMRCDSKL